MWNYILYSVVLTVFPIQQILCMMILIGNLVGNCTAAGYIGRVSLASLQSTSH